MDAVAVEVVAAAIVQHGRLLAARRTTPADLAGRWELPGGKVEPGESPTAALVREVREELSCEVQVVSQLDGRALIRPGYVLTVFLAWLVDGEPLPHEHDAVRWLAPEELLDVDWLPADQPFLPELGAMQRAGEQLVGGNVGGAVRIGRTVRRATGPWTPAVHALLDWLRESGLTDVPLVLGADEQGREVLSHLPGRVLDPNTEVPSLDLLTDAMGWLRRYHAAVSGFHHPGPWRNEATSGATGEQVIVCHHDFAPYNVATSTSSTGERVVGVFDWDMAGPGTRLEDLAFAAWNWVPLWRPLTADESAARLLAMVDAYGDEKLSAADVLEAVVPRIERSIRVIEAGQLAGDEGMLNLGKIGEPANTSRALDALRGRLPAILTALQRP